MTWEIFKLWASTLAIVFTMLCGAAALLSERFSEAGAMFSLCAVFLLMEREP